MTPDIHNGSTPDPELAAALRQLGGEPPLDAVSWEQLHARINENAALPLARRRAARRRVPRRTWLSFPAAAAAVLLAFVFRADLGLSPGEADGVAAAAGLRPVAEEVLGTTIPQREWELLLAGQVDAGALLLAAVDAPPLPDQP